jgi:hypothetical protein
MVFEFIRAWPGSGVFIRQARWDCAKCLGRTSFLAPLSPFKSRLILTLCQTLWSAKLYTVSNIFPKSRSWLSPQQETSLWCRRIAIQIDTRLRDSPPSLLTIKHLGVSLIDIKVVCSGQHKFYDASTLYSNPEPPPQPISPVPRRLTPLTPVPFNSNYTRDTRRRRPSRSPRFPARMLRLFLFMATSPSLRVPASDMD